MEIRACISQFYWTPVIEQACIEISKPCVWCFITVLAHISILDGWMCIFVCVPFDFYCESVFRPMVPSHRNICYVTSLNYPLACPTVIWLCNKTLQNMTSLNMCHCAQLSLSAKWHVPCSFFHGCIVPKLFCISVIICSVIPVWSYIQCNDTKNMFSTPVNCTCPVGMTFPKSETDTSHSGDTDVAEHVVSVCSTPGVWIPPMQECQCNSPFPLLLVY